MTEATMTTAIDLDKYVDNPQELLFLPVTETLSIPPAEVEKFQLAALRKKFAEMREKIPPLANLAAEHGITEITDLNQAAALLFKHSVYKSYPLSLIENARFDRMTKWLQNLATADLSAVRTDDVKSIDDWLDALVRDAGVRVVHTTGTSGKLSFLPGRSMNQPMPSGASGSSGARLLPFQAIGQPVPTDLEKVPTIIVGYRTMYNGYGAGMDALVKNLYNGDESMLLVMEPGRLSADVLSLAGRLAKAEDRGELGRSNISPAILERLDEFVESQKTAPQRRAKFFETLFETQRGKRVMMTGNWSMYLEMVEAGERLGLDKVFSPDSLFLCAGGTKGVEMPEGYRERIASFLGVPELQEGYGMSELSTLMPRCSARKYHVLPWMLVYLLDPKTGEPAPRHGTHTGRFGAIDLSIDSRWPGVLSGDEVTMTFGKCACGLDGIFIDANVRRFTEKEGGDDKITCAGAPQAHDNALAFLAEMD